MRNLTAYYSATIAQFLTQSKEMILGIIQQNNSSAETLVNQNNTWEEEIDSLKAQLADIGEGRILFEYNSTHGKTR